MLGSGLGTCCFAGGAPILTRRWPALMAAIVLLAIDLAGRVFMVHVIELVARMDGMKKRSGGKRGG